MAAIATAMSWLPAARGRQWTGLRLSCDVDLAFAFVAAMPAALALGILVGSADRQMPGAIYAYD
jgi:hypothetical protein